MNQAKVTQLASDGTEMKEGTMWNGEQQQMGGLSVAESGLRCLEKRDLKNSAQNPQSGKLNKVIHRTVAQHEFELLGYTYPWIVFFQ